MTTRKGRKLTGVTTRAQRTRTANELAQGGSSKVVNIAKARKAKEHKLRATKGGNLKLYRHRVEGAIRKHGGKSITEKQALDAIGLKRIGALALAALVSMNWVTRDRAGQIGMPSPKARIAKAA
jgi:hypothetical protein